MILVEVRWRPVTSFRLAIVMIVAMKFAVPARGAILDRRPAHEAFDDPPEFLTPCRREGNRRSTVALCDFVHETSVVVENSGERRPAAKQGVTGVRTLVKLSRGKGRSPAAWRPEREGGATVKAQGPRIFIT